MSIGEIDSDQNLRTVITETPNVYLIRNVPSLDDQIRFVNAATQESQRAQEELGAFTEQHQAILDEYQRLKEVAADAQRKLGSAEASLDSTLRRQAATSAQSQ